MKISKGMLNLAFHSLPLPVYGPAVQYLKETIGELFEVPNGKVVNIWNIKEAFGMRQKKVC